MGIGVAYMDIGVAYMGIGVPWSGVAYMGIGVPCSGVAYMGFTQNVWRNNTGHFCAGIIQKEWIANTRLKLSIQIKK